MRLKNLFSYILNFFLPPRCLMCGVFTQSLNSTEKLKQPSLCSNCWQNLAFITKPYCLACSAPLTFDGESCGSCNGKEFHFDSARAAIVYNDNAKQLITRFKHSGQTGYAHMFGPWMKTALTDNKTVYDGIVPVPLHFWRLWKRGYNQATLLAHALYSKNSINNASNPVILKDGLKRIRHTPSQGHRSALDRVKNMENALVASTHQVAGKQLLLIDDVMTTGATLNECARILKEAGATRVDVLVLARAVKSV